MTKKQKKSLYRILASAALLLIAWLLPVTGWLKLICFMVPYLFIGWDVIWSALRNLFRGQVFDEKFLMALATIGALALGKYAEAVAVMLFFQIGELFEHIAVGKSRKNIAALMDIRPDTAVVLRGDKEETVSPEDVAVGELVRVRPGERVPLDGVIENGHAMVNTAALTGESVPRECGVGDTIFSGSINQSGVIEIRTTSCFAESTVSRILELVENASTKKAQVENFITRFARYYTPAVVIGALVLAIVPSLITRDFATWFGRALIFLVVSCPCALVISVPLSFFGGIGGAGRRGILVKGSTYFEQLAKVKTVVFDKTGTLTKGNFQVTALHPEIISEDELLALASLVESQSRHPIAESIVQAGSRLAFPKTAKLSGYTELAGLGIQAEVDGHLISAGNAKLMLKAGAFSEQTPGCVLCEAGHLHGTIVHLASDDTYLGHIIVADQVKPDSADAIKQLKKAGVDNIVMLTGDRKEIGEAVAAKLGIPDVRTELMPADKVTAVEELLTQATPLAFVGDGINDAPVLTRADIGIAMGALGSDAAIEAADVVLMDDQPTKIAEAIAIARKTLSIVHQNIVFALGVKFLVLFLSIFGYANMWLAIFADVGVTVLAILNAMRCMRAAKPK